MYLIIARVRVHFVDSYGTRRLLSSPGHGMPLDYRTIFIMFNEEFIIGIQCHTHDGFEYYIPRWIYSIVTAPLSLVYFN